MAYLYKLGYPDNNIGFDIDDTHYDINDQSYGDYDVVKRPIVTGTADKYIIPYNKDIGLPELQDDNKYGLNSFYDSRQGFSEPLIDEMTLNVNNGRVRNIFESTKAILPEKADNIMFHDNQETSVKGILNENELSDTFFSPENIEALQMSIRYGVNEKTNQVISNQSEKELFIVMRSIMLQFGKFQTGIEATIAEVKRLNDKVIEYCVNNVTSHVLEHLFYLDEINKLPMPIERPMYLNKDNYTYDMSNLLQR